MEFLDWKFVFIIITFAFIGLICIFKKSKIGLTSASVGIIGSLILWGFFKVRNFLDGVGLSFKDLLNFLLVVITAIIAFLVIFIFLKAFNNFGSKISKR